MPTRGRLRLTINMNDNLKKLIQDLCAGFPTQDVCVSNVFDQRRFARMVHYAWKQDKNFNQEVFKNVLKETELFKNLSDEELEKKSEVLCHYANFAKSMVYTAFNLEKLPI